MTLLSKKLNNYACTVNFRVELGLFRGSGAKENEIELFITNINSGYIPPDKAFELIY
jgi:hypothetical protein